MSCSDVLRRHHQACSDSLLQPISKQRTKRESYAAPLCTKFRVTGRKPIHETLKWDSALPAEAPVDPPIPLADEIIDISSAVFDQSIAPVNDVYSRNPDGFSAVRGTSTLDMTFLNLSGSIATGECLMIARNPIENFSFLLRFTAGIEFTQAFDDPLPSLEDLLDFDTPHNGYTASDTGSIDVPIRSVSPEITRAAEATTLTPPEDECQSSHIGCVSYSTGMELLPSCLDANGLIGKCLEIAADLKRLRCSTVHVQHEDIVSNDAIAARFFSPARLLSLLDYYWTGWHPNAPILHRPIFSALATPSTLLAAMALIGARYSPCSQDRAQSKVLYREVEELTFSHLSKVSSYSTGNSYTQRERVQALQAAYIVLVYQSWDGKAADRHRSRRRRFSQVIEAIQLVGISQARHNDFRCVATVGFDWLRYVQMEEMIR